MDNQSLRLTLSSPASGNYESCWVRLEQIVPDPAATAPNVSDIYNLWLTAATGRSARKLRPSSCPVEFDGKTIKAFLGFYIWPSDPGLRYSLTSALGEIGPRQVVNKRREFSAFIDHADRYALPYYMQNVSVTWETPVYNDYNEQIPRPTVTLVDGIWLVFPEPVFGAIRVAGTAVGAAVVLEMAIEKGLTTSADITEADEEEWRRGPNGEVIINPLPTEKLVADTIKDLKNTITVTWSCPHGSGSDDVKNDEVVPVDSSTSEQVDVVIPDCLVDLLSFCPDPLLGLDDNTNLWCDEITTETVYYNACNGDILGSKEEKDGQSYCSRVAGPDSVSSTVPTWLPEGWTR